MTPHPWSDAKIPLLRKSSESTPPSQLALNWQDNGIRTDSADQSGECAFSRSQELCSKSTTGMLHRTADYRNHEKRSMKLQEHFTSHSEALQVKIYQTEAESEKKRKCSSPLSLTWPEEHHGNWALNSFSSSKGFQHCLTINAYYCNYNSASVFAWNFRQSCCERFQLSYKTKHLHEKQLPYV